MATARHSNISEPHQTARRRVEKLKGFYIHLAVYVMVNIGLFVLDILRSPDDLWFYWVVGGWGAGVLLHAFLVFMKKGG